MLCVECGALVLDGLDGGFELCDFVPDFFFNAVNVSFIVLNFDFDFFLEALHVLTEEAFDDSLNFSFINFLSNFGFFHIHAQLIIE
jgi:hypothetical protein